MVVQLLWLGVPSLAVVVATSVKLVVGQVALDGCVGMCRRWYLVHKRGLCVAPGCGKSIQREQPAKARARVCVSLNFRGTKRGVYSLMECVF